MTTSPEWKAANSLMARLRDETRAQHTSAEQRQIEQSLVRGTISRAAYVAWLGQRRAMHVILEALLDRLRAADPRVAGAVDPALYQTANIDRDLAFLGAEPAAWAPGAAARGFADALASWESARPLRLLGAFYVFEGSKNGARFIAQAIRRAFEFDGPDGLRYLDPHGEAQRGLWLRVRERIDAAGFPDTAADEIVAAAKETFEWVARVDDELEARFPPATQSFQSQ